MYSALYTDGLVHVHLSHSRPLAWKIPWAEEPGGLQSMGSWRVGHDWATSLSLFPFMHWRRKWQPLQCSCLENPRDGGAWWAAVYGVTQSRTRLTWLSNSSVLAIWLISLTSKFLSFIKKQFFHFHALEKEMAATPVFLPGESRGQESLVGCRLWGRTGLDTTEAT